MIFSQRATQVQAHRWDGSVACLTKLRNWYHGRAPCPDGPNMVAAEPERTRADLEDGLRIEVGDWLVQDLDGEWGAMNNDDFNNWYAEDVEG